MRLLICVSIVVLALTSCNRNNSAGVQIDSKLKGYILPRSKALAGMDLDKIKSTDFYRRHQSQLALPQLNQLTEQIGVDPRRDVAYVLLSWDGADLLSMARGTFDPAKLEQRLATATKAEKYDNVTLYGDGKRDVVFLPKSIALAGSADAVKRAVDGNATGGGVLSEDLQGQLARLDSGTQAWLVSSGVLSLKQMPMSTKVSSTLSNISDYINGSAIGVTFSSGAALDAHISCISEEGSQRVHDTLRGLIGLARLSTKDDQLDQLKIWDSIHVEKKAKEVHVSAALTPELADKLIALFPAVAKRI